MSPENVLQLTHGLLRRLDETGIRYVHWKSNEHLAAALRGETDLDLLIDPADADRFVDLVDEMGFLRLEPPRERRLPGLESFLGFDPETGSLVHLDVHYRIVLGEQLLKNHHLPVERWLLSGEETLEGVAVPRPERELLILYIRTGLKTKTRQIVRTALKGGSPYPENILRETQWLATRADPGALAETAATSGLGIDATALAEFRDRALERRFDWRYVVGQKRSVLAGMREYERMPWYAALPRRVWLRLRSGRVFRRLGLGMPRRHLDHATPLVAVVGADGSGKTRLTRDLEKWLGAKLLVRHVYFGQPKSGVVFKLLNKPGSMARNRADHGDGDEQLSGVVRYSEAAKWLWLAMVRRRLARSARSAAQAGAVVIAERYPLSDFFEMEVPMDGPRLQPSGPFARFEMALYRAIPAPDLTLVLHAPLQTLRDRKEDLTVAEHAPKVEAIAALADGPGRVRIDVSLPYEEELMLAKRAIWEALGAGR